MQTYSVNKKFGWCGVVTDKVASVMKMFGISAEKLRTGGIEHKCQVKLKPGDICYLTGASGSGKSVLLRELYEQADVDERIDLNDIELSKDKTLIDCIEGGFSMVCGRLVTRGLAMCSAPLMSLRILVKVRSIAIDWQGH